MSDTPITLLYVEDEPRSRKVMQMAISELARVELIMFEDSADFPARAATLTPAIVFLDIQMQPYTGFEMLAALRQNPAYDRVPVIAMTASVMNEEIEQLRSAGFNGCIAKPIDIDTFPESVRMILNGEAVWRIVA
jgi:CheY-like chemotaxis protein